MLLLQGQLSRAQSAGKADFCTLGGISEGIWLWKVVFLSRSQRADPKLPLKQVPNVKPWLVGIKLLKVECCSQKTWVFNTGGGMHAHGHAARVHVYIYIYICMYTISRR